MKIVVTCPGCGAERELTLNTVQLAARFHQRYLAVAYRFLFGTDDDVVATSCGACLDRAYRG